MKLRTRAVGLSATVTALVAFMAAAAGPAGASRSSGPVPRSIPAATAYGWGYVGYDNLANSADNYPGEDAQTLPVAAHLPTGQTFVNVTQGYYFALGLTSNGKVYAWGDNAFGSLGDGNANHAVVTNTPVAVDIPSGVTITAIAAGYYHGLALSSTGQIYAWGDGANGQLGNATFAATQNTPVRVHLPAGVKAVAVGGNADDSFALTTAGHVYAWGEDQDDQLGNGMTNTDSSDVPVLVHLPAGVTAIALSASEGGFGAMVLDTRGRVWTWGDGAKGELGNGTFTDQTGKPVMVHLPSHITVAQIAAGDFYDMVRTTTGAVWIWGEDEFNELGNGTANTANRDLPLQPSLPAGTKAVLLAAGGYGPLVLTSAGKVYTWGYGYYGELGNGTHPDETGDPGTVPLPSGYVVTSMTVGDYSDMVLDTAPGYDEVGSDGGVFVFGPPGSGFYGSLPQLHVSVDDIVGIVPTSDDRGYFLVGRDGGVFSFGDAPFENSLPGLHVSVDDIVGIVPTSDDRGYFLVGRDGGVFSFGDAPFENSLPGKGIEVDDIVGIAPTPDDRGYWVISDTGTVYALGDAVNHGGVSEAGVVGITPTKDGGGYYIVSANGIVTAKGDAIGYGQPTLGTVTDIVGLVPTPLGNGYWLIGANGAVYPFGHAPNDGDLPADHVSVSNIVGAVPTT